MTRSLVRWSPLDSLLTPFDRDFFRSFDRLAEEMLGRGQQGLVRSWKPAADIRETEDSVVLSLELPGVDPNEVSIEVDGNVLTISGERKSKHESQSEGYQRVERFYGSFARQFLLPEGTKDADIDAGYENGVLEITIPKPQKPEPRRIAISGVSEGRETVEGSATELESGEQTEKSEKSEKSGATA